MMRSPSVPIYCAARILLEREDAQQIAPVSIKMYNIAFREGGEKQGYYHATAHINIFGRDKHHGVHTVLKESIVPGSCGRHDWHAQLRICKHGMAAAAARGRCTYACRGHRHLAARHHRSRHQLAMCTDRPQLLGAQYGRCCVPPISTHLPGVRAARGSWHAQNAEIEWSTVWQVLRAQHSMAGGRCCVPPISTHLPDTMCAPHAGVVFRVGTCTLTTSRLQLDYLPPAG